ncbi:GNAT family N-acetyltransferase [Arthrobacter sp. UCD-GKA]|uniref:GNAT family N-acetyltransferase n=1 Tax=Arthrobacter sp. UCD-GKA TaxID=1913576 RepID=UPI0009F47F38|nr:GNAT family N-acetyltransferase [Arthrobacter sp. UCD-GKA]
MTTDPCTIRLAVPEDIPAALEMKLASWEEAYGSQRPASFFANARASLEQQADWWTRGLAQGAELWIATSASGDVVGVAGGGPAADDDADTQVAIELQVLYVLASHHGTGLGERLMAAALGNRDAVLWVLEHNPRARRFYEKHGFVADDRVEALVDDWAGLNELRMVRHGADRG